MSHDLPWPYNPGFGDTSDTRTSLVSWRHVARYVNPQGTILPEDHVDHQHGAPTPRLHQANDL